MSIVRSRRRPVACVPENTELSSQVEALPLTSPGKAPDPALNWAHSLTLDIRYVPTAELKPAERNARTHSDKQLQQIAASIREFGFVNPILLDASGRVIAGHGRLDAAKILGHGSVPTIRLDHLTNSQRRAYIVADNRLAELADWDRDLLALELKELTDLEIDFNIEITGFETAQIDNLIEALDGRDTDPADHAPEPELGKPAITRAGDLWHLGNHRLLCGDARDATAFDRLLAGQKAQMVFTDPPYNVAINGHVSGLGQIRHREFAMASGEMNAGEFVAFLKTVLANLASASIEGAIHYVCMDWRHTYEMLAAGREVYSEFKNLCVWNKDNGGMGTFYRSKHELIFVFKSGSGPHINNFGLGETGRYRTNVWDHAGVNSFKSGRMDELAMHPTVKPVSLVADAIKDCSKRKGIILDAFGGSGTTLIAAEKTGRCGYLLEIDPAYVDVTIRRWQELTGRSAVHAGGLSFDDLATQRLAAAADKDGAPSAQMDGIVP